jgi:hypothetical protein
MRMYRMFFFRREAAPESRSRQRWPKRGSLALVTALAVLSCTTTGPADGAAVPLTDAVAPVSANARVTDAPCADRDFFGTPVSTANCVIGAVVFDQPNFRGNAIRLWIPRPCAKDGNQDFGWTVTNFEVRSVTVWANCWAWVWNAASEAGRFGPFKAEQNNGNHPETRVPGRTQYFTLS